MPDLTLHIRRHNRDRGFLPFTAKYDGKCLTITWKNIYSFCATIAVLNSRQQTELMHIMDMNH